MRMLAVFSLLSLLAACTNQTSAVEGEGEDPMEVISQYRTALSMGVCSLALTKCIQGSEAWNEVNSKFQSTCQKFKLEVKRQTCNRSADTAYCNCVDIVKGEKMRISYRLEKIHGNWLIDYAREVPIDSTLQIY